MTAAIRQIVLKVLDEPWLPLQVAERELRRQVAQLRAERSNNHPSLWPAINADIAGVLAAATQIRELWTQHEREVDVDDLVDETGWDDTLFQHFWSLASMAAALPEQGFRFCGPQKSVLLRFVDSTSTEDPEVVWLDEYVMALPEDAQPG